jgi:hypothetical protein
MQGDERWRREQRMATGVLIAESLRVGGVARAEGYARSAGVPESQLDWED